MDKRILGTQSGVRIKEGCGPGPCIQLLSKDDENWFETDFIIDASWLPDLIEVLQLAQVTVKSEVDKRLKGGRKLMMANNNDGFEGGLSLLRKGKEIIKC